MGLRDRLKEKAKALLARGPAASGPVASVPAEPVVARGETSSNPGTEANDGFVAVARSAQVAEGKAGTFPHEGGVVAVFRHQGRLYAIDNACAHEDGPVGEGAIAGCRVKCPYHDWEYDFTTGACLTDPERRLATFAVREADGRVWVGRRLTEGTAARGGEHNDGMETIIR